MSIMDFITAVSFGLICFRIGYTFGKDNNKSQNNRSTVRFSLSGKHTLFSLSQLEVEIYLLLSLNDLYIVYTNLA